MGISSLSTSIANLAMTMKDAAVLQQISVAVTKQLLEQQEQQAAALVSMIKQSNAVVNGHVDTYA